MILKPKLLFGFSEQRNNAILNKKWLKDHFPSIIVAATSVHISNINNNESISESLCSLNVPFYGIFASIGPHSQLQCSSYNQNKKLNELKRLHKLFLNYHCDNDEQDFTNLALPRDLFYGVGICGGDFQTTNLHEYEIKLDF